MSLEIEVRNLDEVRRKLEEKARALSGPPFVEAMRDATLIVQRRARQKAPVDTGRLRASIVPEVRGRDGEVQGVVGSNVKYAPFMEFGTRPHWPPPGALARWARRHGMPEFVVARAIAERGIEGRRYLQGALQESAGQIRRLLGAAVARIVSK